MKSRNVLIAIVLVILMIPLVLIGVNVVSDKNSNSEIKIVETGEIKSESPDIFVEGEPTKVDYIKIEEIKEGMTYKEVINILGPAKDMGSGLYVVYIKQKRRRI